MPPHSPPLLEARGLAKTFGSVRACADVSLSVPEGEIVALLGENGAGKSTLVKMLFGALQPDAGTIAWMGVPVELREPGEARRLGIAMVHQHFSLFEALSVAENLALVLQQASVRTLAEQARSFSDAYGLALDPQAVVADLSAGERQRVEIIRCLMQEPDLLIMDEPTSVLTPQEAERLFETLRRLRAEGRSILYISHKLDEVRVLCDRAVIMRAGRVIDEVDPRTQTAGSLAAAMIGEAVSDVAAPAGRIGDAALRMRNVVRPAETDLSVALDVADLTVHGGQILGVAGIAGNGQAELFAVLSGEALPHAGEIELFGAGATSLGIDARRALGAAFVPEERLGHAAAPHLSLADNVLLSRHAPADGTVAAGGFIRFGRMRNVANRVIEAMDVRAPGADAQARALSGGNLQKFVVGRELDRTPRLIVVNQPTWGVDAGAAARIRQGLSDRAAAGAAVIVISQDLDELFALCHQMAVLCEGTLSSATDTPSLGREDIGLMMAGTDRGQARASRASDAA